MSALELNPEEFEQILHVYQRVLIGRLTPATDPHAFLLAHLQSDCPATAAKVAALDQTQTAKLMSQLTHAVEVGAGSPLWQ